MRALFATFLVLVLTGASCQHRGEAPVADPPALCYVPCTPSLTDTGIRWEGDPSDAAAWDNLGEDTTKQLVSGLLTCERRRQACASFIESLNRRGVIRGSKP